MTTYIYVLRDRSENQRVKIGLSDQPLYRFATIKADRGTEIVPQCFVPMPNREMAYRVERLVKNGLVGTKLGGEWYCTSVTDMIFRIRLAMRVIPKNLRPGTSVEIW